MHNFYYHQVYFHSLNAYLKVLYCAVSKNPILCSQVRKLPCVGHKDLLSLVVQVPWESYKHSIGAITRSARRLLRGDLQSISGTLIRLPNMPKESS